MLNLRPRLTFLGVVCALLLGLSPLAAHASESVTYVGSQPLHEASDSSCVVSVPRDYPGAPPPFVPPAGGSATVQSTTYGWRECVLRRRDGSPYARAARDESGELRSLTFYRPNGLVSSAFYMDRGSYGLTDAGGGSGGGTVTCGSDARDPHATRWNGTMEWWITSLPSYLNESAAIQAMRDARSEWVLNRNYCGYGDDSTFNTVYKGRLGTNYGQNGYSTVGFGNAAALCGGTSRIACAACWTDWLTGWYVECDARLDDANYTWSTSATGQAGKADVQSILAHETGHHAGFGHVANDTNVMYPSYFLGDTTLRQLGKGDALGNNAKY